MDARWEHLRRPIHGIAALLHPHFRGPQTFRDPWLQQCKHTYSSRIHDDATGVQFTDEMSLYENQCALSFSLPASLQPERQRKAIQWWETFGFSAPLLQTVAFRVLSQVSYITCFSLKIYVMYAFVMHSSFVRFQMQDCSSSACERNWSAYSLIHTRVRNRLSTRQLERLVYCRANMRLLDGLRSSVGPKQVQIDKFF